MRRRDVNPIDVIEAAYDLERDDKAWIRELAMSMRPLLDGGHGVLAYVFDVRRPPSDWYTDAATIDFDRSQIPMIQEVQGKAPDITQLIHAGYDGLLVMSELWRKTAPELRSLVTPYYAAYGLADFVALQTVEPGGRGVVFCAGQGAVRTFDRRTRRLWTRVNAHLAAGRRLRSALMNATEDAILDANGKVHHAENDATAKSAREVLRDAVKRVEKARGRQRRSDPEGATEAWTALVSGRWSLVDRYERDGRRYIIARRNEHTLADLRALTPRESAIAHLAALGKANKLIGYELGLAESTVGSHLSHAMKKLGVATRVELIQLLLATPRL